MTEIGTFLKKLRGNTSLREVQREAGVSHTYLSSLEKGKDPRSKNKILPSPDVLKKLAIYYEHPYLDLMIKTGYASANERYTNPQNNTFNSYGQYNLYSDLQRVDDMLRNASTFQESNIGMLINIYGVYLPNDFELKAGALEELLYDQEYSEPAFGLFEGLKSLINEKRV